MYEGKDKYFNLNMMIQEFLSGGEVSFGFEEQNKSGAKRFISFTVHEIMNSPGKTLMERFSEMKEKNLKLFSIMYSMYSFNDGKNCINITNDMENYHRWNYTPEDRMIENIHSDLEPQFNKFSLDWNDSKAELAKGASISTSFG